jgi:HSP20 family protein
MEERNDDFFYSFSSLKRQIDGLFDSIPGNEKIKCKINADVYETEELIIVLFELPGVKKENIQLNLSEDSLVLSAEKKIFRDIDSRKDLKKEIFEGYIERNIHLEKPVIKNDVKAQFDDGILRVYLKKQKSDEDCFKQIIIE